MAKVKQAYKPYAGIGSRSTPKKVLDVMSDLAYTLEDLGYILRTGGATGADTAFLDGITKPDQVELYLPWQGYNDYESPFHRVPAQSINYASRFHDAWGNCKDSVRKLHGRNANIILGRDVLRPQPAEFVICHTEGGKATGGTGLAIRIADAHLIQVFDFGLGIDYTLHSLEQYLGL